MTRKMATLKGSDPRPMLLRVPPHLKARVKAAAKRRGISVNRYIIECFERTLEAAATASAGPVV